MFSMSFTNELDIYEGMMAEGMVMKASLMERQSEQCLTVLNQEHVADKLVIGEEIVVGTNGYLSDKISNQTDATVYFEQNLDDSNKISMKYDETNSSVLLTENLISENWQCEDVDAISSLKESEPDDDEDEETIATFITAKGEQLALYAVENFDEMFAVAVYDESGKPPSDFQFLMKADVERLISEGAVRTVKKPTQMKRRLVTSQPQLFYQKEDFEVMSEQVNDKPLIFNTDSEKSATQEENCTIEQDYQAHQNFNDSLEINSTSSDLIYSTTDTQSDITYLMMDDNSANIGDGENRESNESEDNRASESEMLERSTVQYIFFENEQQSDSDLTFDEIQATLQNLKTSREKMLEKEDEKSNKLQDIHSSDTVKQDTILHDFSRLKPVNENSDFSSLPSVTDNLTCVSATDDKFENERQRLIDTLTGSPPPLSLPSSSTSLSSTLQLKVKRSRKQQLISVNRDDSEIIFQPPLLQNEEARNGKKRSKQRRRTPSQMRRGYIDAKRMKRTRQREEVEVIDLDADEEEQQAKRNIVEITLDDSTDKYSSDKENEIIMVRDSDSDNGDDEREEEEEDRLSSKLSRLMRCEHCSRNFRLRRALETHLRVCQKSAENALRLNEEKGKVQMDKQYPCKICQEKFDVVVALARHVRVAHSLRKKHKLRFVSPKTSNKSLGSVKKETSSTEEEELAHRSGAAKRELSMLARVKRKRRKRSNYTWEKNNLTCADCGKLFLSTTLLDAHVLQHGTKKSEQRLRKCHVCQQLIRSKFLFLRHLRMHSETQSSSDNNLKLLQHKLRARSNPHKIASRKRGRPRKF